MDSAYRNIAGKLAEDIACANQGTIFRFLWQNKREKGALSAAGFMVESLLMKGSLFINSMQLSFFYVSVFMEILIQEV